MLLPALDYLVCSCVLETFFISVCLQFSNYFKLFGHFMQELLSEPVALQRFYKFLLLLLLLLNVLPKKKTNKQNPPTILVAVL